MKKLIFILVIFLISLLGYSQDTDATLRSYTDTYIISNASRGITATMLNSILNDLIDSKVNTDSATTVRYNADTLFLTYYSFQEDTIVLNEMNENFTSPEFGNTIQQTISLGGGATTFAVTSNVIQVTGHGGANTIATITGAMIGLYTFIFVDGLVTISNDDGHGADTIDLDGANDFTSAADKVLTLVYTGTSWYKVSESTN